jgi:hypothetical protein
MSMRSFVRHALGGLGLALPFVIANAALNQGDGPWRAALQPHSGWLVWPLLALMLGGAVVAVWPLWHARRWGWGWANAVIGSALAVISLVLLGVFAEELLRCDLMGLRNCD